MKSITIDGKENFFFLERGAGDDGLVINYLAPNDDGTFTNFREYYDASVTDVATSVYTKITLEEARQKQEEAVARDLANKSVK